MDKIIISDLELFYRVGVPEEERVRPQRLLLTIELEHDFQTAAASDDLRQTINYFAVTQKLLRFGEGRSWKLLETLAVEIADLMLEEFKAAGVSVEIKKFIIPEARFVGVKIKRQK
ncbi:MAG: dihydroneopterin aldolase [Verrucomicrobiota bacterium]|nr:dihydroneopterin aldolase [Verrucomicrobiota bacterium]